MPYSPARPRSLDWNSRLAIASKKRGRCQKRFCKFPSLVERSVSVQSVLGCTCKRTRRGCSDSWNPKLGALFQPDWRNPLCHLRNPTGVQRAQENQSRRKPLERKMDGSNWTWPKCGQCGRFRRRPGDLHHRDNRKLLRLFDVDFWQLRATVQQPFCFSLETGIILCSVDRFSLPLR